MSDPTKEKIEFEKEAYEYLSGIVFARKDINGKTLAVWAKSIAGRVWEQAVQA